MRQLSSASSKKNWQSYVKGSDAISSVQLEGPIAVAARDLFTRAHIGRSRPRDWESDVGTIFLHPVDDETRRCVLSEWIRFAGASLTKLQFGNFAAFLL